jgi:hypothetical protein
VEPGRLLLRLGGGALVAANTGAPLDATGVESLSTLRASAKRGGDTAGRFGVGFAAVLAVTDAPEVRSTSGAVRWSRVDARAEAEACAAGSPALADELARRDGGAPVLRLPFPAEGAPPEPYTTAVVLPLRGADAEAAVRQALDEVDAALLLTLPSLGEVVLEVDGVVRTLRATREPGVAGRDTGDVIVDEDGRVTRWRVQTASGVLDPALLTDRPTEERARPAWWVTCAVPVDDAGLPRPLPETLPRVVHAPTPTAEPADLPLLLAGSFPLDSTRRHVAPGALRDHLAARAAAAYAALVAGLATDPALLALVPGPVAAGALDGAVREEVRRALAATPLLPEAGQEAGHEAGHEAADAGDGVLLRPRDAVVLGADARGAADPAHLATVLPGLVDPAWWRGPDRVAALRSLGARETPLADVVDALAGVTLAPEDWHALYAALDGADRDALGTLPVPLADGRVVRGSRGLRVPEGADDLAGLDPDVLAPLGLRLVHPAAAHPLLTRLGAVPATPETLLDDPSVHAAVAASYDEDDPGPVAEAVLALVAAARPVPGAYPWLSELALPDDDGEWAVAGELLLPGGPLAGVVADDTPFGRADPALVARWGADVCEAVGVLRTFARARAEDVPLDPDTCDHDLDAEDAWVADVLAGLPPSDVPPVLGEHVAVRDLELVDPARWPDALALLAVPPLREAVTTPGLVLLGDGRRVEVVPYTAWWLSRAPVLGGHRPVDVHLGDDPRLTGLYAEVPSGVDADLLRALGARTTLEALLATPGGADDLLARLADPGRAVGRTMLRALYRALAAVPADDATPPEAVRAVRGAAVVVADPGEAVVLDAPDLWPHVADRPLVLGPLAQADALADLLALPLASEVVTGDVTSSGREEDVPAVAREALPDAPRTWVCHAPLVVDDREVPWRVRDGVVHASGPEGLARGLAWACGAWERRLTLEALLRTPGEAPALRVEEDLEG